MKKLTKNNYKEKEYIEIYYNSMQKNYRDPDSLVKNNYDFYHNYWKAINKRLKAYPKLNKKLEHFNFNENVNGHPFEISMKIKGKEEFTLKSDQFGFSVKEESDDRKTKYYNHPYFVYYLNNPDKEIALANIIRYKNITRLVGGSFLWPLENGVTPQYNPPYNLHRGGNCYSKADHYIQDRVDLTLYEVQEFYDYYNKTKKHSKNNKPEKNILINDATMDSNMFEFLSFFENFQTFIKVFGFDDNFVRRVTKNKKTGWKVVNIFRTKNAPNYINKKYIEKVRSFDNSEYETKISANTSLEDFENMFNFICKLIEDRRKKLGVEKESD